MKFRSTSVWILVAFVTLVSLSCHTGTPLFSCERHIYNDSECKWTLQRTDAPHDGNVWFDQTCILKDGSKTSEVAVCPNVENGPCTLLPRCSVKITYTYSNGYSSGTWKITDEHGQSREWRYNTQGGRLNECTYIMHSGSTGPVYLNEPANGDMTFGGCSF